MQIKIYADQMVLINSLTNFIILMLTDSINRIKTSLKRKIIISVFISVFYVVGVGLWFNFFLKNSYIIIFLLAVFYSVPRNIYTVLKNFIIINILSYLIYGISAQFDDFNVFKMLISFVISLVIIKIFLYYISFKKYYNIVVFNNNKKVSLKALLDSGNLLTDPLSGKSVVIVERNCVNGLYNRSQLRTIPYKSIGNENGEFYVFNADRIRINNHNIRNPVIAIYNSKLSDNGKYNAIISLSHIGDGKNV